MAGSQRGSSLGGSHTFPLSPSRWSWLIAGEVTGTLMSHRYPRGNGGLFLLLPLFPLNPEALRFLSMPLRD